MERLTRPTSSFSTDLNRGKISMWPGYVINQILAHAWLIPFLFLIGAKRDEMKEFWLGHSQEANVEKMFLDSGATETSREELPEVLSLLPNIRGKKVLELAGGIGRFTGIIAQQASHVTTVDFMESFIEESKRNNKNYKNIHYVIDDAMNLEFENESFDLIFSNWFLMYFCEDDLHKLARKLLMWLKDGGFFFSRESCVKCSGNSDGPYNPTFYRLPGFYNNFFQSTSVKIDGQTRWGFDLRFTRNLQSFIKFKGNRDQICWLVQKKHLNEDIHDCDYKQFLRNKQSSKRDILRYEKIFGAGFINIGGLQMVQEFTSTLHHQPGQKVLDVGCGIGGADFYMAKEYGAEVTGVDVSSQLIEIAWEKKYKTDKDAHVCFEIGDITDREYPGNFFDVIISRDAMRHVRNKKAQMTCFLDWLKPGGRIVISDFCLGECPYEEDSAKLLKRDSCELYTLKAYHEMIKASGFVEVKSDVRSELMVAFINSAKVKVTQNLQGSLVDFTKDDLTKLVTTWDNELKRYETRDQIWCFFSSQKPRSG